MNPKVKVGDTIKIIKLEDPFDDTYPGRVGKIVFIDDMGYLHGTWGGLSILPEEDEFELINQ